ncbi:alpha/beta hydrolase [Paenibacillus alginolyticus]|uniref:Lysophospholipase n=1 Tax=Paenibacillus alginolyticus TaxID=59839 RepID=A0ABT4G9S4_9BACL|nr:alpha/beta hydrolase [Paenibacillus alginolyticus]MCY9692938.1 lysophospholipase [Paenibacillus alginolyticus]MEC0144321.1 alpha/beta hydrolase [Paenibacillus alginolyticus]
MNSNEVIKKTIEMSHLSDGFWSRWLVHGLEKADLDSIRHSCTSLEEWVFNWTKLADSMEKSASFLESTLDFHEAEQMYRKSSLYFNLAQWIFPIPTKEKKNLLIKSQEVFHRADSISPVKTEYLELDVDGHICAGRIRIPEHAKGCVILINPIDSSKEELYLYEKDFVEDGFATVSYDGPGQGSTFAFQGRKATQEQLRLFIDKVIDATAERFPDLALNLIGTSTGGGWAIYGSCNEKVSKAVAVSPAIGFGKMHFSDYFKGKFNLYLADGEGAPDFEGLKFLRPVRVYHGGMDRMVPYDGLMELYNKLPSTSEFFEYSDESHCCNFRLNEIRKISSKWYTI